LLFQRFINVGLEFPQFQQENFDRFLDDFFWLIHSSALDRNYSISMRENNWGKKKRRKTNERKKNEETRKKRRTYEVVFDAHEFDLLAVVVATDALTAHRAIALVLHDSSFH
jgi:hypothetical protein